MDPAPTNVVYQGPVVRDHSDDQVPVQDVERQGQVDEDEDQGEEEESEETGRRHLGAADNLGELLPVSVNPQKHQACCVNE